MNAKKVKQIIIRKISSGFNYAVTFAKWVIIALLLGVVGGVVGSLFHMAVNFATEFRQEHGFMIYLAPLAGLAIVFLYKICKVDEEAGTNLVINSVRSDQKAPIKMAPLIFASTVLTHAVGGSAGREGAALQLGGSIGAKAGEILKLDEKDMSVVIMCGMSAVFSALFGTPLTAAFFAMEVISVGVIYYVGLVPCMFSSIAAYKISTLMGLAPTSFNIGGNIPEISLVSVIQVGVIAVLCAVVSIIFCVTMEYSHKYLIKHIPNAYVRILVGSAALIIITLLSGCRDYNGSGVEVIVNAIENGDVKIFSFAFKIIFTAITISSGFKGGEIVPTFFIGSTFGCAAAHLVGLNPCFGAAIGLVATFCAVVNCPAASILLAFELFGTESLILFALACAISYMLSGYYGLYTSQKIIYSKLKPEYINIHTK